MATRAVGGATGLRTIWITLRAVNYTGMVFRDVIRATDTLDKEQQKLAKNTLMAGQHALSAGLMWVTLGQSIDDTMSRQVASIGVFQDVYNAVKPVIGALITFIGIMQMLIGLERIYTTLKSSKILAIYLEAVAVNILASSWRQVAVSMMAGMAIFLMLKDVLGTIPALLIAAAAAFALLAIQMWIAAGAMSVITWGMAAIAGGLAIAGAIAAVSGIKEFPMGTRMIEATGPAIVHKGEIIYNPATNRPTQVGNDLRQQLPSTTIYDMPINIREVHTKADIDDVDERLRESWRRLAKNASR